MDSEWMKMLVGSVAPAFLLLFYVRYRDRKNPEPWGNIVKGVFYGVLSIFVSLLFSSIISVLASVTGLELIAGLPLVNGVYTAFFGAAIPEETAKLIMLWLVLRKNEDFNVNMDGIVYAVCVGMGFAAFENVCYVTMSVEDWRSVVIMRSLLAVPGHYIFAVLVGFLYSLVHFHPHKFHKYRFLIWLLPVLAHGVYDSLCMVGEGFPVLQIITFFLLLLFCYKMHKFCYQRIGSIELIDEDRADLETFTKAMRREKKNDNENFTV